MFFLGEFSQLGDKKRNGESNKGIFEICKKQIAIFWPQIN
jgi:hypothetical protein